MEKKQLLNSNLLKFIFLFVFILLTWVLGRYFPCDIEYYKGLFSRFPLVISGAIFVLFYVIVSFFVWIIKDILKVAGALLFGAYISSFLIWFAEMINAALLFHLSRLFGRKFVESKLKGNFVHMDERIGRSGFWGVFAFRIVPLVPFRILDLVAGLTSIDFRQYFLAVVLGSPLRIFWIQVVLAVVGMSVFKEPQVVVHYFQENPLICFLSFVYFFAAIILAIFLKRATKNN